MSYQQAGAVQMYRAGLPQFDALVNPAAISGVKAWWKASSIAQSDSTAVTTWTDSIASISVTQGTGANQPTYRTTQGPNSTPAVSFDAGDVVKNTSILGSTIFATNQVHIFMVLKQDSTQANNGAFNFYQAVNNQINILPTFSDVIYWDFGDKTAGTSNGRLSVAQPVGWDNSWRIVQFIRDTGNNQYIRDQGSQLATASRSKTLDTTQTFALRIGSEEGETIFFKGFIADILIYNVALGTTDRQSVEAYFNSLYTIF